MIFAYYARWRDLFHPIPMHILPLLADFNNIINSAVLTAGEDFIQ